MKDFKLQLDYPANGIYYSGYTVSGTVIAVNDESPKSYKSIEIRFKGTGHVHWDEIRGYGENTYTVTYSSEETYLDESLTVWDKDTSFGDGKFPVGSFMFPFSKQLPSNIPASYSGKFGKISYNIEARVVKTSIFKHNTQCEASFEMGSLVYINTPSLLQPQSMEVQKTICCLCCASGPVVITANIPRSGYCVQTDAIPLEVIVQNGSSRVVRVTASICQTITYSANGHYKYEVDTITGVSSEQITAHNTVTWQPPPLAVPYATPTSAHSSILSITYTLKVEGSISMALNPTIKFPITLGNVPLQQFIQPSIEQLPVQAEATL